MIKEKYINNVKETCITITNSNIEAVRIKNDTKTSLRVYKDGLIGVAGSIGKFNEAELEKEAIEALKQNIEYSFEISGDRNEKIDKRSDFIKDDEIVNEVDDLLSSLRGNHSDFIFSNKIRLAEANSKILNDRGLNLEYGDKCLSVEVLFKHKNSSSLFDGFIAAQGRKYDKSSLLKESELILNAFNTKVDLPKNKKYPVVFLEYMMPTRKLISELFGISFATGSSLFSNKLGQKIFNDNFTFYESRNPNDALATPFFDAEGVVNKDYRYALIENGVLMSPYTDKRTSKKFNLPLTGSATSAYDGVPTLSFTNSKIKESQNTLKELIGGDMAILSLIADGGDFTSTGDFATPVQLSFLFDGEKIIGRLPEIQFSSNIYDMFGTGFRGVSKDTFLPFSASKFEVMDLDVSKI